MILLCTDFQNSIYTGQVIARISEVNPSVRVINAIDDLNPFNIQAAAYLLAAYVSFQPKSAVILGVVDPGVGSSRKPIILSYKSRWYVGPDNGIFSRVAAKSAGACEVKIFEITGGSKTISRTFHGRDIFAPVAAQLVIDESSVERIELKDSVTERLIKSLPCNLFEIVYIDSYGNCFTGIQGTAVGSTDTIQIHHHQFHSAGTFSDVNQGEGFWYVNSLGLVEVAVNRGSASNQFQISVGDKVITR